MATLTEAEILLKEQIELQKGIDLKTDAFKSLLASSKQYQQMLRSINRELFEQATIYGKIRERNEAFIDSVAEYRNYLKDNKLSTVYDNIYKTVGKVNDEFRELNAKLQTGDVSLKEYQKSYDKLASIQRTIDREKKYLTQTVLDSLQKEYSLQNEIYNEQLIASNNNDEINKLLEKERLLKEKIKLAKEDITLLKEMIDLANQNPSNTNSYVISDIEDEIKSKSKELRKFRKELKSVTTDIPSIIPNFDKDQFEEQKRIVDEKQREKSIVEDLIKSLEKEKKVTNDLTDNFKDSKTEITFIEKKIGNVGRLMSVFKGLGFNSLFDFEKVEDAMQAAAREEYAMRQERERGLDVSIKKFGVLRAGASAIGSELASKFGTTAMVGGGVWLAKQLLDLMFMFDERWREISKNQTLNRQDSVKLLNVYQSIANENERINLYGFSIRKTAASQKELMEASLQLSNALGVNYNIINKEEGDLIANIKERMGLSEELRQNLLENSLISNESFNKYFDKLLGVNAVNRATNKFYMNDKSLLNDMSKASSFIRLQFKNHSTDLAQIVINSKRYGMNLQELESSMSGMLDWEKQNELQTAFFLQSGQYVDTSRLQIYALTNQLDKYQEEFNKLTGSSEEFLKLNRIAQETKASLFGQSVEQFSQMLLQKELMDKINKDEAAKQQMLARQTEVQMLKEYELMKKQGLSQEKIFELMGKNSETIMSQIKSSEEFGRAIEKIKDTFASFVENEDIEKLIQSLASLITNVSEFLIDHAGVLGIRTPENVKEKYKADADDEKLGGGLYDLQFKLKTVRKVKSPFGGYSDNSSIIEEAEKDLATLTNDYAKKLHFKRAYYDDFYEQAKKNIISSNAEALSKTDPNKFFDALSRDFIRKNPNSQDEKYLREQEEKRKLQEEDKRKYDAEVLRKQKEENDKTVIQNTPKVEIPKTNQPTIVDGKNIRVNDSVISPNGNVVISTPEGQIKPNAKDYIITTTEPKKLLNQDSKEVSYNWDDSEINNHLNMILNEIRKGNAELIKALLTNKDIYLNQRKVGETINMNNPRV